MSKIQSFVIAIAAATMSLAIPIAVAGWTILSGPPMNPDSGGTGGGAAIFLVFFLWPILAVSLAYHLRLLRSALDSQHRIRVLYGTGFLTCMVLSLTIAIAFFQSGLLAQIQVFLTVFIGSGLCMLLGAGTLHLGIHRARARSAAAAGPMPTAGR
ncbi:MAG: hypothetical protein PHP86_18540 [Nevskiales bacterium]|nr:hypothetical protein [Nevskiales bacterium]